MNDEAISLTSSLDGFEFAAWRSQAGDARRGGLIVIQEIFGVTDHIRQTAAAFAGEGYETLAPSLFDRRSPGFAADYDDDVVARGRELSQATPWSEVAADLAACVAALAPPVFAVGYCWGGTAAWLAACRIEGLAAASSYYGRRIPEILDETPLCPLIAHFGRRDPTIPPDVIARIGEAHPDVPLYLYDAGHGFASDRADRHADSARLAWLRTLQLFARHGGRGEF
ncbi:MAG TPA: dienelactone hydrolase family protein [Caulobacteraceae bacterium]|jgi:carboxymethylenebutenolidase|nr:dienelactone hydrolase family protein [Caulobacteraceae bacterium]